VGRGGREKEAEERAVASETERKGGTPGSVLPAPFVSATRVRMGARRLLRERRSPQRTNRLAIPAAASATLYLRVVLVVRFASIENGGHAETPRRRRLSAPRFRSRVLREKRDASLSLSRLAISRYRAISLPNPIGASRWAHRCGETIIFPRLSSTVQIPPAPPPFPFFPRRPRLSICPRAGPAAP